MDKNSAFFDKARDRKSAAESYWTPIYKEYELDARFFTDDQWEQQVLDERDANGRPALTFNQVKQPVLRQINSLRQNKPAIEIDPRDNGASEATAEFFAGKIRNIEYCSQADTARSHAAKCAAIGGIGYYRINIEYPEDSSGYEFNDATIFDRDLYIRPILDPRTVLWDKDVQRFDFSDADYCFVTEKVKWDDYKRKYPNASTQGWEDSRGIEGMSAWSSEEDITIAEYWHVEKTQTKVLQLTDGTVGLRSDMSASDLGVNDANVAQSRTVERRIVHFDKINGMETLEETIWPGYCIPILVVLGDLTVVKGQRKLSGMIRSSRDAQRLLNGYASGTAENIGLTNRVPYTGPKGMFKGSAWKNAHKDNPAFLEWDLVYDQNGMLVAASPQRNPMEPAVQALGAGSLQMVDFIKRGMGYADDVIRPSQSDLSGVAQDRRNMGQDQSNFHIADSLALAMWHEGNIYLDVLPKIHDTPKRTMVTSPAGDHSEAFSTQADDEGNVPLVDGIPEDQHHRLDIGRYMPRVSVGPTYATKIEQEEDFLSKTIPPELMPAFLPTIFRLRGYPDLAAIAEAVAPPAIQQLAQGNQPLPPQAQQAMGENMQLKQQIQQLTLEKLGKTNELSAKMADSQLSNMVKIIVADIQAKSHESIEMLTARMTSIETLLEHFHQSELAPGPAAGPLGIHPQPLPPPMAPGVAPAQAGAPPTQG